MNDIKKKDMNKVSNLPEGYEHFFENSIEGERQRNEVFNNFFGDLFEKTENIQKVRDR